MNIEITIKEGVSLQEQTQVFQAWFNENCMPHIDFADTCTVRDEFGRPYKWLFDAVVVMADYYTQNENYNFNKFLIFNVG